MNFANSCCYIFVFYSLVYYVEKIVLVKSPNLSVKKTCIVRCLRRLDNEVTIYDVCMKIAITCLQVTFVFSINFMTG